MGWLKIGARKTTPVNDGFLTLTHESLKAVVDHVENISLEEEIIERYLKVPQSTLDSDLPFIEPSEVVKRRSRDSGGLWIVVDNVVYDVTEYLSSHPGGEQVIKSFAGAECSWQFWRFHGKKEMETEGKPLRIGRTLGLKNKYPEPVRYVGLRNRNDDEW